MVGPGGMPDASNFRDLVCPTGSKAFLGVKREICRLSNLGSADDRLVERIV
jgi:hypothetical protein